MRKKITIPIKNSYDYIRKMNGFFNLTEKESFILSKFVDKHDELVSTKIDPFSSQIKRIIADDIDIDDYTQINVYIKRLKDKGAIRKDHGSYIINPLLRLYKDEEGVDITWQIKKK